MDEYTELLNQLKYHVPKYDAEDYSAFLKSLTKIAPRKDYIVAALLAFAFSESPSLPEEILVSETIKQLYHSLIRLQHLPLNLRTSQQIELSLRLILSCSGDLELLTVLLVLKLHKLIFIEKHQLKEPEFAQKMLCIYSIIANRLGIFWIKSEIEDRAFHLLSPDIYYELKHKVAKKRQERTQMVETLTVSIGQVLNKAKLVHEVKGRYKRFYSIHEKLKRVDQDFERIQDLVAFRVLMHRVEDCYAALGYIHNHWEPKTGRFKDYITQPKANGYQSLHTTVLTDSQERIEIQIRTHEMHQVAEYGVAAHWLYKEKKTVNKDPENEISTSINLFADSIYPMTPAGEIIELPQGGTVIDFAYAIHTELGNRIVGAKVNQNIFKLDAAIKTQDCVEILTSSRQTPHQEWLGTVQSRKARTKIRHAIHKQIREKKRKEGWEILEKEFRKHALNLNRLSKEGKLEQEIRLHKYQSVEQLMFDVGDGTMRSSEVIAWFLEANPTLSEQNAKKSTESFQKKTKPKNQTHSSNKKIKKPSICVDGMEGIPIRHAKCCSPMPHQKIEGYITREHAIVVHHEECSALSKIDPQRRIPVHWRDETG